MNAASIISAERKRIPDDFGAYAKIAEERKNLIERSAAAFREFNSDTEKAENHERIANDLGELAKALRGYESGGPEKLTYRNKILLAIATTEHHLKRVPLIEKSYDELFGLIKKSLAEA